MQKLQPKEAQRPTRWATGTEMEWEGRERMN